MAAIQKHCGLQWRARARRRGYPTQTKTFPTRIKAETWARQVEGEMDRGVFISRAEADNTTLAQALGRYTREILPTKKSARPIRFRT